MMDITINNTFSFDGNFSYSWDYIAELQELYENKTSGGSWIKTFTDFTNLYLAPVIIFTGLCGNALSFIVFSFTYLRLKSSSVYLAMLSAADAGFLLCLFFIWLAKVGVPLFHMQGWCQIVMYLNHVFNFLSAWSVVGFTCERYITVYHPIQIDRFNRQCTRRLICLTILFSLILYIFVFWTSGVGIFKLKPICMPIPQYYDTLTIFIGIDMFIAFLLPSGLIVVLNIRIMLKLRDYQLQSVQRLREMRSRQREYESGSLPSCSARKVNMVASLSCSGSMHFTFVSRSEFEKDIMLCRGISHRVNMNHIRKNISQYRTARILLLVSTVFLILNSPNHFFKLQTFIRNLIAKQSSTSKKVIIWQEFFQLFYFLNFAINFFIYSLCSKTFRSALKRIHGRCKKGTSMLIRVYKKSTY